MNEARIAEAALRIADRKLALRWLEQYGGRDYSVSVEVYVHYAGACPGAKEANKLLTSCARFSLPEIVKAAIECCRNDIDLATEAIKEEIAKLSVTG